MITGFEKMLVSILGAAVGIALAWLLVGAAVQNPLPSFEAIGCENLFCIGDNHEAN